MNDLPHQLDELRRHVDSRLDRIEGGIDKLEGKIDTYSERQATHASQIQYLQGFAKLVITILLACAGFMAAGYFTYLGAPK